MNIIQIGSLIVGGFIILSYFIDFKKVFSKMSNSDANKKQETGVKGETGIIDLSKEPTLSSIVQQWEVLKSMCQSLNLNEANAKLEEVFPLFVKKG